MAVESRHTRARWLGRGKDKRRNTESEPHAFSARVLHTRAQEPFSVQERQSNGPLPVCMGTMRLAGQGEQGPVMY